MPDQPVARIRPARRHPDLVAVTLGGGRRLLLQAGEVQGLGLIPGTVVDAALEERLAALHERTRAREAALRLLRYRPRSAVELATRLRRHGFAAEVIDGVVNELCQKGLIDDARFAHAWAEHRALGQTGPLKVRAELRAKGVAPALIEAAIRAVFAGQEAALAAVLIDRHVRRLHGLPPEVQLRRLAGVLLRRGFSGAVVASLLRRALDPRRRTGEEPSA